MEQFVANLTNLKVKTPDGYKDFAGIVRRDSRPIYRLNLKNHRHLDCTQTHKVLTQHGLREITQLQSGQSVFCSDGRLVKVVSVMDTGRKEPVYDLIDVEGGHLYYTNGLVSKNCDFVTTDETLINPLKLRLMEGYVPAFKTGEARWYRDPEPNKAYLVGLDPSLGMGRDYGAIEIFQLDGGNKGMVQIAEWQHNLTTPAGQVRQLLQMLLILDDELRSDPHQVNDPEIYWTIENNSIGEALLIVIEDTGEEKFPGSFVHERKRKGQVRRFRKGLYTDNRKKLSACARLKSLIESDRMTIYSQPLIRELKNFVASDASFKARSGEHDDLVTSCLLLCRMLDVVLWWGTQMTGSLREIVVPEDDEMEPMPILIG